MEKRRIIDINATSGDWVTIRATRIIRRMIITESVVKADGVTPNVPQGLQYRVKDDGTAAGFTSVFQTVPPTAAEAGAFPNEIRLGSEFAAHEVMGEPIGCGPTDVVGVIGGVLGTKMTDVKSVTDTATSVLVVEYE